MDEADQAEPGNTVPSSSFQEPLQVQSGASFRAEAQAGAAAASAGAAAGADNTGTVVIGCLLFSILNIILSYSTRPLLGGICLCCTLAQLVGLWMGKWVLSIDEGSESMRSVGNAIREGSEAYVKTMFGTIFWMSVPMTGTMFLVYWFELSAGGWGQGFKKALMITLSFVLGAFCSSAAGVTGMWSSTRANSRVAQTACASSYKDTIVVALRSGAVAGITVVSLCVSGICFLFSVCFLFVLEKEKDAVTGILRKDVSKVPILLVGYGFGASFVAMFAQLGGGIFTKAADVGADLCGKIELEIPEDDPRNPAVIADLVGDNVGDCCARGADLFESLAAEIIAAMILGGQLTSKSTKTPTAMGKDGLDEMQFGFILFPLVVHVADLIVSTIGVMAVRGDPRKSEPGDVLENPMGVLKVGYVVAVVFAAIAFGFTTFLFLNPADLPGAWWHFTLCGGVGMVAGFLIVLITQHYTDFMYPPVQGIAAASESGHGVNVIAGLAVGMESVMMPILLIIAAILTSFFLGRGTGLETFVEEGSGDDKLNAAGLFGTAVATMGMLSNLTYVLAMDVFGPIADNSAGIVEMSPDCPESAREIMDRLDAAGNTTKAFTKGFAVSSAGLACFLLFRAFLDIVQDAGGGLISIDIVDPQVFCGGLLGSATVFLFAAFAMQAVGDTAQEVVAEVRRQFREMPGIMTGEQKPEYGQCVAIVSKAAIEKMVKPGALVVFMPVLVGAVFRLVGMYNGDQWLGAKCMTSYLVCSSMTAMLMALFLNNSGGAWDNAKKYIESGHHGGKGSEAHKAAVTGDTVGDPCKDTAGPSLHVLMKLTATVTMVLGPLVAVPFVAVASATTTPATPLLGIVL